MNPNNMLDGVPQPPEPLLTILTDLKADLVGTDYESPSGVEMFLLHTVSYLSKSQAAVNNPLPANERLDPFRVFYGGTLDADEDTTEATVQISCKLPFPQPSAAGAGPSLVPKIVHIHPVTVGIDEEFAIYGVNFTGVTLVQLLGVAMCTLTRPQDNTDTVIYASCSSSGTGSLRVITPNGQHVFADDFTVSEPPQP